MMQKLNSSNNSKKESLTEEQLKILQAVRDRLRQSCKTGILIEAFAGTGKSTMLTEIARLLKEENLSSWECRFVVFGRKNKEDLSKKMSEFKWEKSVQTLNSLGYEILRDVLGKQHSQFRIFQGKYTKIAQDAGYISYKKDDKQKILGTLDNRDKRTSEVAISKGDFEDLIDKIRLHCFRINKIDKSDIWNISNEYGIQIFKDRLTEVTEAVCNVLATGLELGLERLYIDFLDQIWLTWYNQDKSVFEKWKKKLRVICIDECQDTDPLQIAFIKLLQNPSRGKSSEAVTRGNKRNETLSIHRFQSLKNLRFFRV